MHNQTRRKYLDFAAAWLDQARLDASAGRTSDADKAMDMRRSYQRKLLALRNAR